MTVFTQPGWLQNAGSVHSAEQMRNYAGAMFLAGSSGGTFSSRGGVHPHLGNKLQVTQTGAPSMAILIRSGLCAVPGSEGAQQGTYGVGNDGDVTVAISAAHATLARIDIAVVRVRDSAYSGALNNATLEVVAGTPAGSPVAPSAPANSLTLATIQVNAAATSITNANITDSRRWMAGVGGVVRALSTVVFGSNQFDSGQPVYETDTGRLKITTDSVPNFKTVFTDINVQSFASSGTWNKPAGAEKVYAIVIGGGGGGGGVAVPTAGQNTKAGGGGEGGRAEKMFSASALTATEAVTVGAGGTAGASGGGVGGTGGTSSFDSVSALGGGGGNFASTGAAAFGVIGGVGGTSSGGDWNFTGSPGGSGWGDAGLCISGPGGGHGGGIGRAQTSNGVSQAGASGGQYGGGGGGAAVSSAGAAAAGGAGGGGVVIVYSWR